MPHLGSEGVLNDFLKSLQLELPQTQPMELAHMQNLGWFQINNVYVYSFCYMYMPYIECLEP